MEYMECSVRFCLLFLIRAVVDHTCEWGIIKSCLKRDKCLSQPNNTLHFPWVPPWELESWASCRSKCSWKNCCDGMLQQFSFCKMRSCVPCLNAPPEIIWKSQQRGKIRTRGSHVVTWWLAAAGQGRFTLNCTTDWMNPFTSELEECRLDFAELLQSLVSTSYQQVQRFHSPYLFLTLSTHWYLSNISVKHCCSRLASTSHSE